MKLLTIILAFTFMGLLSPVAAQTTQIGKAPLTAADAQKSRDAAVAYLAQELATVQAEQYKVLAQGNISPPEWRAHFDRWLKHVAMLRDTFNDNPYIKITGFTVSIPSGIGINVEFK